MKLMNATKKVMVRVDADVVTELRKLCLDKHGKVYAVVSGEATQAILDHITIERKKMVNKNISG